MKITPPLAVLALFFALALNTQAASSSPAAVSLHTLSGQTIKGEIASVHGGLVVVAAKKTHSITPLANLDDASLNKVADFIVAQAAAPSASWETSSSAVAKSLHKKLLGRQGDRLVPLALGDRPEPEFYLAYYSAHWCGPCRAFTPELVAEYHRLQAKHPGRFELVFISSDFSSGEQAKYVREANMPWPVVKLSATDGIEPLKQWHGDGIPDLIVTNREGHVILKSYDGENYIGPAAVLSRFAQLLISIDPANPDTRLERYRLETILHLRSSTTSSVPAKPYNLSFNPRRYQTLGEPILTATLKIDAEGKVTEVVTTTPELSAVLSAQFQSDTAQWLFLPAAENGQAKECTVRLPLKI